MRNKFDRSFRVLLDGELAAFVRDEARREGISESAVLRQSVGLRLSMARRRASMEAEMIASAEVC